MDGSSVSLNIVPEGWTKAPGCTVHCSYWCTLTCTRYRKISTGEQTAPTTTL